MLALDIFLYGADRLIKSESRLLALLDLKCDQSLSHRSRPGIKDIDLLAASFLETFNSEDKRKIEGFTPAARKALFSYSWPGNIRELKNAVESAVVLARGKLIDRDDLPQQVRESGSGAKITFELPVTLDEAEKRLILETISYARGNKTKAAELLGIGRKTITRRMQELKIGEGEE